MIAFLCNIAIGTSECTGHAHMYTHMQYIRRREFLSVLDEFANKHRVDFFLNKNLLKDRIRRIYINKNELCFENVKIKFNFSINFK